MMYSDGSMRHNPTQSSYHPPKAGIRSNRHQANTNDADKSKLRRLPPWVRRYCSTNNNADLSGVAVGSHKRKQRIVVASSCLLVLLILYNLTQRRYGITVPLHASLCPHKVRMGSSGDGGWWTCGDKDDAITENNNKKCIVYSFGIRDNFSFDHALASQRGCTVHGFDPSPDGVQWRDAYESNSTNLHYHDVGLGAVDRVYEPGRVPFRWPGMDYLNATNTQPWRLSRLRTLQGQLQHDHTGIKTILKIDIEGGEWDIIADVVTAEWDELYMELHFPPWQYRLAATLSGGWTVVRRTYKLRSLPARNVQGPVDRMGLIQQLLQVADLFHWEFNGAQCVEVYFKRKETYHKPHRPFVWLWRDMAE